MLVDMNDALSIMVEVEPGLDGKHFALARIRAYTGSANQQRADVSAITLYLVYQRRSLRLTQRYGLQNWQALAITVAPLVPVRVLPKRLHTAFWCVQHWLPPMEWCLL